MNGQLELRIITQPYSEVYWGYLRRLAFGNSLTKHIKLSSFSYSVVILILPIFHCRLVFMLTLPISHLWIHFLLSVSIMTGHMPSFSWWLFSRISLQYQRITKRVFYHSCNSTSTCRSTMTTVIVGRAQLVTWFENVFLPQPHHTHCTTLPPDHSNRPNNPGIHKI